MYKIFPLIFFPNFFTTGCSQLSPAIILITGVAHDGGIVQIDLFTRGSQNLVSGKLRSSGFWRYGQFFK